MTNTYLDRLKRDARLTILRFLNDAPQYTSNCSMLATLLPSVGITFTRDQVKTELQWLEEQSFVALSRPTANLLVATATRRGVEIATGIATHDDISRPAPEF